MMRRSLACEFIADQARRELVPVLIRDGVRFEYPPAEELLSLPSDSIELDRTQPKVIDHQLRYPGY